MGAAPARESPGRPAPLGTIPGMPSQPPLPRVAVIVPCYNHARFVGEAVRSALAQVDADVHAVVVDDGSDDGTTPAACDACALPGRVRVLHQPNRGLPAARNAGARAAGDADYLVFLDADDTIEPGFVRALHASLVDAGAAGPGPPPAGGVSHAYCQERLTELGQGVWAVPEWDPRLLMITNLHPVTALVRRACFEHAGGFDESMRSGYEDWDFWLRMAGRGWRGVRVREPLFLWRRHSPTTMVMESIRRHDELYARLIRNHPGLYEGAERELLVRTNTMLRAFDVNWLDEDLQPIPLRDLRAWARELEARATHQAAELESLRARLADGARAITDLRNAYEAKPAVRLSRRLHAGVDALPPPLAGAARRTLSLLARLLRPAPASR